MQAAIMRVSIDRATGRQLEEQIIGYEEIDGDSFYRPLVEVLGKRVLEALQNKQGGDLMESTGGGATGG